MLLTEKKRLQNQTIFACQYIKKKKYTQWFLTSLKMATQLNDYKTIRKTDQNVTKEKLKVKYLHFLTVIIRC